VSGLSDCREIEFSVVRDPAGDLAVVDEGDMPFPVRRVFYLHSVPAGARRGGHAHRRLEQVLVAVAGRFDVVLDDGAKRRTVRLDDPNRGLFLPTMIWREMVNFSPDAVCLVLASAPYDEADYIRDYDEFVASRVK
jgi:dTDP-4-dehydrorhamnose 3,5-epimerase-like enzyme